MGTLEGKGFLIGRLGRSSPEGVASTNRLDPTVVADPVLVGVLATPAISISLCLADERGRFRLLVLTGVLTGAIGAKEGGSGEKNSRRISARGC